MSPTCRHLIAAVLLGTGTATIADLRPPTIDDAATFIEAAVQRHHVTPAPRQDERAWRVETAFSGCTVEQRASYDERVLRAWQPRLRSARWDMRHVEHAAIAVRTHPQIDGTTFVVTVPCAGSRACVDRGRQGRHHAAAFEFTSRFMAERVAAALRYAGELCSAQEG